MRTNQIKFAFFVVWIILSIFILIILITPFIFSADSIHTMTSKIKTKHENKCILCGMTTSFICITKGRFNESQQINRSGIYFFTIFLVNQFVISYILINKLKNSNCKDS